MLGPPGSCNLSPENFDPPIFPSLYPPDDQDLAPRGKERPGAETLGAQKALPRLPLCARGTVSPLTPGLTLRVPGQPSPAWPAGSRNGHLYRVNELLAHEFPCRVIPMAFYYNPESQYITNVLCKHNKGVDPTH